MENINDVDVLHTGVAKAHVRYIIRLAATTHDVLCGHYRRFAGIVGARWVIVVVVVPSRVVVVEAVEVAATELVRVGPKQAVVLGSEIVVVADSSPVAEQGAGSNSAAVAHSSFGAEQVAWVTHSSLTAGMTMAFVVLATETAAGRVARAAVPKAVVVETAWEPPD